MMRARLLVLTLMLWLAPVVAHAHASLVSAVPADGAVIARAPAQVVLTFNEPVSPLSLRLVNPIGETVTLDAAGEGGTAIAVALPALGEGTHALSYRVVSTDGHPVAGSVIFSVGRPTGGRPVIANESDPVVRTLIVAAKVLLYLGLFIGIGGRGFAVFVAREKLPPLAERAIAASLMAGMAAAVLSIGLQGADALALPVSMMSRGDTWQAGLATSYGTSAIIALAAMLILPGPSATPRFSQVRAIAALLGAGLALAASGHAAAAPPQWLTRPSVFIHVVCVACWIGSLVPLLLLLRNGGGRGALMRFTRIIPFVLVLLIAAGIVLAVVQIETPAALLGTNYGVIFICKMVAFAALLVLAAYNRFVLTARADAGRRFGVTIGAEIACVLAILALVALWRFTPPPRALAAENLTPLLVHMHGDKAMSDVVLAPARAGPVIATIAVQSGDFGPLDAKEVTLGFANTAAKIEGFSRPATKQPDGRWRVEGLTLPVGGRWTVTTEILIDDFTKVTLEGEAELRP